MPAAGIGELYLRIEIGLRKTDGPSRNASSALSQILWLAVMRHDGEDERLSICDAVVTLEP